MRPYLALIKDSFRAAVASNVLYVLLAVITFLLVALAPLRVKETLDWRLNFGDNVTKVDQLAKSLVDVDVEKDPALARVWDRLENPLQKSLQEMVEEKAEAEDKPLDPAVANSQFMKHRRVESDLEDALNEIIKSDDFYDEEAWSNKRLNREARAMVDEGVDQLSEERNRRLNRLLMASATGGKVKRGGGNALDLWYGPWQWDGMTFPISHKEFANYTLTSVTYFFDKFVLSIGLLIAILVTSNFIPETFLPGSLNLLMSKPISRWGLLLAKFAGGCAFVSLCAVYLFVGLWLWLGIQMNIWDRGILWAIPLYIVVFAIYYSVSTFIGVYSRSAILSIVVTGVFWAACFAVGVTYSMFDGRVNNSRTRGLVAVKDKVLHVGELSTVSTWDAGSRQWKNALEIKMMEEQRMVMSGVMFMPGAGDDGDLNTIGPVYDPKHDVVLSGVINLGDPGTINYQDLFVANADDLKFNEVGKMPRDAIKAVSANDGVLVFTRNGNFWRYVGEPESQSDKKETKDGKAEESGLGKLAGSLFSGNKKKKKKKAELFKEVTPKENVNNLRSGRSVAFNPKSQSVYVLADDELTRFDWLEGKYEKGIATEIESTDGAIVAAGGKFVVTALKTGKIQIFDAESLDTGVSFKPQNNSPYESVIASNDGKYFVLQTRNRKMWLLNTERLDSIKTPDAIRLANVSGQGNVTAASFDDQNRLWYSTKYNRTHLVDLENSKNEKSYKPSSSWFVNVYEYGVNPMYWMFPKPGEFYKLVIHLSAAPSDDEDAEDEVDLRTVSDAADPWQPLWSGLLFMCAMLFLTGLIFQYRDF